jgi:hypothetical protein
MAELPAAPDQPLHAALETFHRKVLAEPRQPLNQLAEEAVLHWTRVVEGQEAVQPRLNERGYAPAGFHFAMEGDPANRLDGCGLEQGAAGFEAALQTRLSALAQRLETYFSQPGHRSSTGQCDQVMLELARCSRFFHAWAHEGERHHRLRWRGRPRGEEDTVNLYGPIDPSDFLACARWQMALWEPYLNTVIVAWEENQLDSYDRALREVGTVLGMSLEGRAQALAPPGFPLRRRGQPRQKVMVFEPEQRPLRSRSVFTVRYAQLLDKLAEGALLAPELMNELAADVEHFTRMVETNLFLLASAPAFYERGRAGLPLIRNRPTTHPFLLDPTGFFKKAVLFHNGTYTIAGGGLDLMYLQLRQLERLCKFMRWGEWARPLRRPLEEALIAWDENKWGAFTAALMLVAELMRRELGAEEG